MKKSICILTDGNEIQSVKLMTASELTEANEVAKRHTADAWWWTDAPQKALDESENLIPALRLVEDALKNHVIETFGSLEAGHKWYLQYAADPKARRSDVVSMAALLNLSKVRGENLPVS